MRGQEGPRPTHGSTMAAECSRSDRVGAEAVLVVDDEAGLRRLVRRCLEPEGIEILEAASIAEAREQTRARDVDLVLLDLSLPDGDGLDLCREWTQTDATAPVPIMIMTGAGAGDALRAAYEAGATDFVTKPFEPDVLRYRVRYLLRASYALRALRRSQERLAAAQRIAHLGHWEVAAADGDPVYSEEAARVLGLASAGPLAWRALLQRVADEDRRLVRAFVRSLREGRHPEPVVYRFLRPDGQTRWLLQQARPLGTGRGGVTGTLQDITERKQADERIRYLAYRDVLTGLPNRRLLSDRLRRAVQRAGRNGTRTALLHLDIDRFKTINEGFGHEFGDKLLCLVARRLEGCLRATDTVAREQRPRRPTLSRLGGDEFMIVLDGMAGDASPTEVARRLLGEIARPFDVDGAEVLVSASIGIALFPEDGADESMLVRHADTALAHAKAQGGNCLAFYDERMNSDAAGRLELAGLLHRALATDAFHLVYQPIFDADGRSVRGVEALLRWCHPERGEIEPGRFIPVAEETGLILPLGDWVLRNATRQWRAWLEQGAGAVEVAVNVSARQFQDPGFIDRVKQALVDAEMPAGFLRLELTEGVLMASSPTSREAIAALRDLGVGLSIDDYGTGYSSLGYLRRFPVDTLKIDRSFVRGVPEQAESCGLVGAIVAMAHKMRLQVVAEGVETEAQMRFLRALDCELVQGYLLGRPVAADELSRLLRERLDGSGRPAVIPFRRHLRG